MTWNVDWVKLKKIPQKTAFGYKHLICWYQEIHKYEIVKKSLDEK